MTSEDDQLVVFDPGSDRVWREFGTLDGFLMLIKMSLHHRYGWLEVV